MHFYRSDVQRTTNMPLSPTINDLKAFQKTKYCHQVEKTKTCDSQDLGCCVNYPGLQFVWKQDMINIQCPLFMARCLFTLNDLRSFGQIMSRDQSTISQNNIFVMHQSATFYPNCKHTSVGHFSFVSGPSSCLDINKICFF